MVSGKWGPVIGAEDLAIEKREAEVIDMITTHLNVASKAQARLHLQGMVARRGENTFGNAVGQHCLNHKTPDKCKCETPVRFKIRSPGPRWVEFAEEAGEAQAAALKDMIDSETEVTFSDILNLMGKHTLVLRPELFKVELINRDVLPSEAAIFDPRHIMSTKCLDPTRETKLVEFFLAKPGGPPMLVEMQKSHDDVFRKSEVVQAVVLACRLEDGWSGDLNDMVQQCFAEMENWTMGVLKSIMQKLVRFSCRRIILSNKAVIDAEIAAVVAAALIAAMSGGFQPELQIFTRGPTAVFKRVAVMMVEDAVVDTMRPFNVTFEVMTSAIMCAAYISQRKTDWNPTPIMIQNLLRLVVHMVRSPMAVNFENLPLNRAPRPFPIAEAHHLQNAARALRILRSFSGDMDMMDGTATFALKHKNLAIQAITSPATQVDQDGIWLGVDQHALRGIGHVLPDQFAGTFTERFRITFTQVSGINPRRHNVEGFLDRRVVNDVRRAQRLTYLLANRRLRLASYRGLPVLGMIKLRFHPDAGVLAAAVGPREFQVMDEAGKRVRVLVMLGVDETNDLSVMVKPSRQPKDLFNSLDSTTRQNAISQMHTTSYHLTKHQSFYLGDVSVRFDKYQGVWLVGDKPWDDIVRDGLEIQVPEHPAPAWVDAIGLEVIADEAILESALFDRAQDQAMHHGIIRNARHYVRQLAQAMPIDLVSRAAALIFQQTKTVHMPVTSLSGGMATNEMMAMPGDWSVWRFLVLLSRLVPGALRAETVPRFTVLDPRLLLIARSWILNTDIDGDDDDIAAAVADTPWCKHVHQTRLACDGHKPGFKMMDHQIEAVDRLNRRDARRPRGHFLVLDTGTGKTLIAVCYLIHRLCSINSDLGRKVKYIFWVMPKSGMGNAKGTEGLTKMMRDINMPFSIVDPKNIKATLKPYSINFVDMENVRRLMPESNSFARCVRESVVVFDEVHMYYNATKRTAFTLQMADLCQLFIAQTATPVGNNTESMRRWLASTENFPITEKNYLVGAANMVALKVAIDIERVEELVEVERADAVTQLLRQMRGFKLDWRLLSETERQSTDEYLCQASVSAIERDCIENPHLAEHGVLLVADNARHQAILRDRMATLIGKHRVGIDNAQIQDSRSKPGVQCIIVTKTWSTGYNFAVRFGALVQGVMPGNAPDRKQMRGRLVRISQPRKKIWYVTVVMKNTILSLLRERQRGTDAMAQTLEQLALEIDVASLLDM